MLARPPGWFLLGLIAWTLSHYASGFLERMGERHADAFEGWLWTTPAESRGAGSAVRNAGDRGEIPDISAIVRKNSGSEEKSILQQFRVPEEVRVVPVEAVEPVTEIPLPKFPQVQRESAEADKHGEPVVAARTWSTAAHPFEQFGRIPPAKPQDVLALLFPDSRGVHESCFFFRYGLNAPDPFAEFQLQRVGGTVDEKDGQFLVVTYFERVDVWKRLLFKSRDHAPQ